MFRAEIKVNLPMTGKKEIAESVEEGHNGTTKR